VELEISAETARKRSTDDLQKSHANGHDVTDPATVDHPIDPLHLRWRAQSEGPSSEGPSAFLR
jgi:hypothetical protein